MVIKFNAGQSISAPLAAELGGLKRLQKFVVQNALVVPVSDELVLILNRVGANFFAELKMKDENISLVHVRVGKANASDYENVEFPQLHMPANMLTWFHGPDVQLCLGQSEFCIYQDDASRVREWLYVAQIRVKHEKSGLGRGLQPWFLYSDILKGTALSIPDDCRDVTPAKDLERRIKQNDTSKEK